MKRLVIRIWKPVFAVWMRFAHVLGIINTAILLTIVYVVMILPLRIVLAIVRKDPLHLRAYHTGPAWTARATEAAEREERSHPF